MSLLSSIPNPLTGLTWLLGSGQDVVGIYTEAGKQLFVPSNAIVGALLGNTLGKSSAMHAEVNVQARIMDHPLETGAMISDFMVYLPVEIDMTLICTGFTYSDVYKEIRTAYVAQEKLVVVTKSDVFLNMVIYAIPHDENPEMFDALAVTIRLREVLLMDTQYQDLPGNKVQSPNDQSTINVGSITPTVGQTIDLVSSFV